MASVRFNYNEGHGFWEYLAEAGAGYSYSIGHKSLTEAVRSAKKWARKQGLKWQNIMITWAQ